ncbi:MAG: 4Fe-4S dicluster domain-containing protein [Deltaproteobacteria bacterium]|nr:4Fe-4S dicluster domain-containing protein [Deltaproteobacteria bacterium]
MEYRFLSKKEIASFVTGLLKDFKVYGPVKKDGFSLYAEIASPKDLNLLHTPTHLSPKQYLFPPKETLLTFKNGENPAMEPVVEANNQVLFGVHPCDIHAIRLLDRVFSYGPSDVNYIKRREKTLIAGIDCIPDKYCFCKSVNTMNVDSGFDIFLHPLRGLNRKNNRTTNQLDNLDRQTFNWGHDMNAGFLVEIGTQRGKDLLHKYTKTRKATAKEIKKIAEFKDKKAELFAASINVEASSLPLIYSGSYNSPVWEKVGKICYGCGSCNNVCPTCYCFDVRDNIQANLTEGERYRVWDACLLEDFAKVAGGHNFRKTRAERLRHRFNRKFQYQVDKFGGLFCVGCGRCNRTCLVNINIVEVTNELIEESNKRS